MNEHMKYADQIFFDSIQSTATNLNNEDVVHTTIYNDKDNSHLIVLSNVIHIGSISCIP